MKRTERRKTFRMAVAVSVAALVAASPAVWAFSSRSINRIGIYDIQHYGQAYDNGTSWWWDWKHEIPDSGATSAGALWTAMTSSSCTNSACAYTNSFDYTDTGVTVANMNNVDHCRHRPEGVPFSAESPEPGDHPGVKVAIGGIRGEAGGQRGS